MGEELQDARDRGDASPARATVRRLGRLWPRRRRPAGHGDAPTTSRRLSSGGTAPDPPAGPTRIRL